jgi:neurofibromin 1
MVATQSNDISFRDFGDRVLMKVPVSAISDPPPALPLPAENSPRSRPSAISVSSSKMCIKSISHIAAANAEYENTHMSLVTSSKVVNDLIAKHVGRIIFHLSASNWKVVLGRLSDKINFIATHPDITPDSIIDLQFMSHCVMDRTRLVVLLNRASFFSFSFFSIVT